MFEQSLQTEEWKDKRAIEGRSPEEIRARQMAAVLIAANAVFNAVLGFLDNGRIPILQVVVGLALAHYLLKLRPRAENLAIGLAILGAVLVTVIAFRSPSAFEGFLRVMVSWAVASSLLMLLIGRPSLTRQVAAVALYIVFGGGFFLLALVGHFLGGE